MRFTFASFSARSSFLTFSWAIAAAGGSDPSSTESGAEAGRGPVGSSDTVAGAAGEGGSPRVNEVPAGGAGEPGASTGGTASDPDGSSAGSLSAATGGKPPVRQSPPDPGEPVGFATVAGYGLETTTGAGNEAETVAVTSFAEFITAVADDEPRVVQVSGTIMGDGTAMVDIGSNKTIVGLGTDATIDGFGLDINGWTSVENSQFGTDTCGPEHIGAFTEVSNVIVHNLTLMNAPDDSINVQCYSHHIWVHHNVFHTAYDGSIDIKRGSDLVTVAWNHFIETEKTMLLGHSANNGEQDRGYLRVTYHHNWFDLTATRTPRVRFGYAHVFNNYLDATDYFLGLGIEASIYAEGNYVAATKTITQTFTESVDYHLTWTDTNHYDEATITRANDSQTTMIDWLDADGTVAFPTEYGYSLDPVESVPEIVQGAAGIVAGAGG